MLGDYAATLKARLLQAAKASLDGAESRGFGGQDLAAVFEMLVQDTDK